MAVGRAADVRTVGVELVRLLASSHRVSRAVRWGLQAEMLLAESAREREVLNDLLEAYRLLVLLQAPAEQREAKR